MNFISEVWEDFLSQTPDPYLWVGLMGTLLLIWVGARLLAAAQIKNGGEPIAAARKSLFFSTVIILALAAGALLLSSTWTDGYLLPLGLVFLLGFGIVISSGGSLGGSR